MTRVAPIPLESDVQIFGNGNVRPHRLVFDPSDPAFLSRTTEGALSVRLVAPAGCREAMFAIRYDDRILGYPLRPVGSAGGLSLWEACIEPFTGRFECSIAVRLAEGAPAYLSPTGVTSAIERIDRFQVDVSEVAHHEAPEWAAGAVIYQIFPDRFANGDPALNPPDVEPWDAKPGSASFLGGDLRGIAARVDHLVELGVDAVYLNPIFTSPSNHRYDTADYYSVDPVLGGDDALGELVGALHGHGIRLILDTSFNHCHPQFFAFADVVANGERSAYADWFVIRDWPLRVIHRPHLLDGSAYWVRHIQRLEREAGIPIEIRHDDGPAVEPTYDAWYGVPIMPRIDLSNAAARRYMLGVATHWVRKFDIDGWRMDVVRYIDHDFWAELRSELHAVKPDTFLIAEVMGDARRWLHGGEFDATMNYTFRELCLDHIALGRIDVESFLEGLLELLAMYSPTVTHRNHNLLGSHDTPRFVTLAGGDERKLLLATLIQLTFPGAPGLYYGDELPIAGEGDPDNRRGFDWDAVGSAHHDAVRRLLRLRHESPALRKGRFTLLAHRRTAFAYQRETEDERIVVAVNTGARALTLELPRLDGGVVWSAGSASRDGRSIRLGACSGAVIIDGHGTRV